MKKKFLALSLVSVLISACSTSSFFPSINTDFSHSAGNLPDTSETSNPSISPTNGEPPSHTSSPPLEADEFTPFWVTVQTGFQSGKLNYRLGPGIDHAVIGQVQEGTTLRVYKTLETASSSDWYLVQIYEKFYWVNARFTDTPLILDILTTTIKV